MNIDNAITLAKIYDALNKAGRLIAGGIYAVSLTNNIAKASLLHQDGLVNLKLFMDIGADFTAIIATQKIPYASMIAAVFSTFLQHGQTMGKLMMEIR